EQDRRGLSDADLRGDSRMGLPGEPPQRNPRFCCVMALHLAIPDALPVPKSAPNDFLRVLHRSLYSAGFFACLIRSWYSLLGQTGLLNWAAAEVEQRTYWAAFAT